MDHNVASAVDATVCIKIQRINQGTNTYEEAIAVARLLDAGKVRDLDGVVLRGLHRGVAIFVLLDEVGVQLQEGGERPLVGIAVRGPLRRLYRSQQMQENKNTS
jgi:hypothetical protein